MHAFISYLRENTAEVDRLAADLRANGVDVWLDRESIRPGEVWQESIRSAIKGGAYFVACFSTQYEQRDTTYMDEEVAIALGELETRTDESWFLPVKLSPFEPSGKRAQRMAAVSAFHWVDLSENWDRGVRQMLEVMSEWPSSHHYLRSGITSTSDPYAGTTNARLLEELLELTKAGGELDAAKRYEEAASCFARGVQLCEAIEKYRLDSWDRHDFLVDSFTTHFNLTLSLFKSNQRLRASNEAVKAAKRYAALLRAGEAAIGPDVRQMAEASAEALMSIGRELLNAAPENQRLEGFRLNAAILDQLADANPLSFRRDQGVALHALAQAAQAQGLQIESDRAMTRSIEALREAHELHGDVILRDIGQAMRTAIDSFGQEQLRPEYDELVRREVDYVSQRSPALQARMQEEFEKREPDGSFWKKFRIF